MLRDETEAAPRSPASMLDSLDDLVERSAHAGLTVRKVVEGDVRRLPASVELAAFRIVQEAITNVVRHSGAQHADVRLDYGADVLSVRIDDAGSAGKRAHPMEPGSGLRGMKERATALGGTLTVGAAPTGGVRIEAVLPVGVGHVIRVVLADDQALLRAGLRALLDAEDDIEVVGEAANGREAISLVRATRPDVVLMDIRMPGIDGLEATRAITDDPELAGTRVVVLTTFDLDEYVFEAVRIGASGFLVKDTEPAELLRGVRAVADGDALLSPGVTRRLIGEFANRSRRTSGPELLGPLTEREREVVALVGEGLSNDEIAARLVLSPATAKTHVSRAMVKLQARDRAQLVVLAYETGLVRPGWSG